MKNFSTWLLVMFIGLFWIFRIVVALTSELGMDIGFVPLNKEMEIALLFIVLFCIVLIIKRNILGAIIYLLSYGMYFGVDLFSSISTIIQIGSEPISLSTYANIIVSLIGMIIPIAVLFDLLLDKNRMNNPKDKNTDWFYKNEEYDRKMDDRADKNNYRTL